MSKVIYITESDTNKIADSEIVFQTFYEEVIKYIRGLLNDPIHTTESDVLKKAGIDEKKLRKELCSNSVIVKTERIDEPTDEETNKKVSRYYVSYKVPKQNFKDKLRKVYNRLVNNQE